MRDELDELLNDIDLDGISDLDDITPDNVSDILGKYKLDKVTKVEDIDLSEAEKMLNDAYAMVNDELDDEDDDLTEEELEKLHQDIKKEVKKTLKHDPFKDTDGEEVQDVVKEESDDEEKEVKDESSNKENVKKKNIKSKVEKEANRSVSDDESDNVRTISVKDVTSQESQENEESIKSQEKNKEDVKNIDTEDKINESDETNEIDKIDDIDETDEINEDNESEDKNNLKEKASDTFKKLFYNVQDEEYEKQQRKLERKEKRQKEAKKKAAEKNKADKALKAEEKKKKAAEDKATKAKALAEAKKKKAESKKKQAEKKKKQKAELEKAMENEPVGRINKLGAVVVFMFIALITCTVILFSIQIGKLEDYEEQAREYMAQGQYEQAYMILLKEDNDKIKDTEIYEQLRLIQKLNKKISYYSSNMALLDREKALDALLTGVELYDADCEYAKKIGIGEQYDAVFNTIVESLKSEYKLSLKEARKITTIKSHESYSEKIEEICKKTRK